MNTASKLTTLLASAALMQPLVGAEYSFSSLLPDTLDGTTISYRPDLNYNNDPSSRWFSFEALDGANDGALVLGYQSGGVLSTAVLTDFTGLDVAFEGTAATITQTDSVVGLGDAETLSGISYRWQKLSPNNSASPNIKFEIWGLNGIGEPATFMGTLVYNSPQNSSAAVGAWVEETNIEDTPRWWATGTTQTYNQTLSQAIEAARDRRSFPTGPVAVLSAQLAVGSTGGSGPTGDLIQGAVDGFSFEIAGGNNDGEYVVNFEGQEGLAAYQSIQAAINAADPGDTILLKSGTWSENVTVNKSVTIQAASGAEPVVQALGGLGSAFTITASDVTIQGITAIGGDTVPAQEAGAIRFTTSVSNVSILDNTLLADGEAALMTNSGVGLTNVTISGNYLGGKSFVGDQPANVSFSEQFVTPNVARQILVIQTNASSSVTFSDNVVGGQSGANGIGNTLATIDSENAIVTGNSFEGEASGFGTLLRARRAGTVIEDNSFDTSNLSGTAQVSFLQNLSVEDVFENNSFDKAAISDSSSEYIYSSLTAAITASTSGAEIVATGDFVENVDVPANKVISLVGVDASITGTAVANVPSLFIKSSGSSVEGFTINRSPNANTQNAVLFLGNATDGVLIAGNVFNSSGPIIEAQGANTTNLDIIENTFNASAVEGGFVRGIYINGGYTGPGSLNGPATNVYIAGNSFVGEFGLGNPISVEGQAQVTDNDFSGVTSANAFVGTQVGPVEVDGNCFPDTDSLILGGSNGQILAAYNYFGRTSGPVESNYVGDVTVAPYLTSCESTYIQAIQAPGGTISPAFAYVPASTAATFTITPAAGSVVQNVQIGLLNQEGGIDSPTSIGAATSYTFANSITGDRGITATFNANAAVINASVSGGNGTLSPVGSFTLANGGSKTFIATPAAGYSTVVNYDGNGTVTQGAGGLITVSNITGTSNELTVSFVAQGYTVTVIKSGQYASIVTIDPAGPINDVTASDSTIFTVSIPVAAANAGVKVSTVRVNGVTQATNVLNGQSFTLTGVNQNTTVEFVTAR